jgi:hypothetical protein
MQNEKTIKRMKIIRGLLLVPVSIIMILAVEDFIGYGVSEMKGDSAKIAFLILHGFLTISGAILSYFYGRYIEGEGAKWSLGALFFPYIFPAILFFKSANKHSHIRYVNGVPVKTLVDDFESMFAEFNMAEAERCIASGQKPDSKLIATASFGRVTSYLSHKYRLSPEQILEVADIYLEKQQ